MFTKCAALLASTMSGASQRHSGAVELFKVADYLLVL